MSVYLIHQIWYRQLLYHVLLIYFLLKFFIFFLGPKPLFSISSFELLIHSLHCNYIWLVCIYSHLNIVCVSIISITPFSISVISCLRKAKASIRPNYLFIPPTGIPVKFLHFIYIICYLFKSLTLDLYPYFSSTTACFCK